MLEYINKLIHLERGVDVTITLALLSIYLFFAVLVAGFFAAYALSKGTTGLVKIFASLSVCVSLYLLGYLLELNSSTMEQMVFWNQIQYLGIPFFPAFWLLLSFVYTKTIKSIHKSTLYLILMVPILTFLIRLTNPLHHLYYRSYEPRTSFGFSFLALHKGPCYFAYGAYLIFCFVLATFCYVKSYSNRIAPERGSYRMMIGASFIPFLGVALILIDPGALGIDYTALLLPLSLFFILLSLFKYDFLELKTLAREILFERSAEAMILIDNVNRLMDYNHAAATLFNELNHTANGQAIETVFKGKADFLETLKTDVKKDLKITYNDEHGYFEVKTTKIENSQGHKVGRLISLINITERKQAQEVLSILATTDSLTGLYNRGQFIKLGKHEIEHACQSNTSFSLLMIDVDHFKSINDTRGHAAGDTVLKHLGSIMKVFFRRSDIVGRLGGEEFGVILPNVSIIDAKKIAEEFRNEISKSPVLYEGIAIYFTLSIGISTYNKKYKSFDQMLKIADEGLYQSKTNGRNQITAKVIS
jgi:diguanylate cyclase (GGDEF)-like protein